MTMSLPPMDGIWMAGIAVQWLYTALVLTAVNRLSSSFAATLAIAALGSMGFYWLGQPGKHQSRPLPVYRLTRRPLATVSYGNATWHWQNASSPVWT